MLTECTNVNQPGVAAIVDYLKAVNVKPNCQLGTIISSTIIIPATTVMYQPYAEIVIH